MKAITLHQPWVSWIARGWKTIETRTHNRFRSLQCQRIAIHAGQHYDEDALHLALKYLTYDQVKDHGWHNGFRWPHGAVICTAFVYCHALCLPTVARAALIECDTTRFGLFLKDIQVLPVPIFCAGHQGIWEFSP